MRMMPSAMNSSMPEPIFLEPHGVSEIMMVVQPTLWRNL